MNKKEKYINFIVADLIKKTEIDYKRKEIRYTFIPIDKRHTFGFIYPRSNFIMFPYESDLKKYVIDRYGAREEETKDVYYKFIETIKSII